MRLCKLHLPVRAIGDCYFYLFNFLNTSKIKTAALDLHICKIGEDPK